MTYTVTSTIEDSETHDERALVQMIHVEQPHTAVNFENEEYVKVTTFRFEAGWIQVDPETRIEITRLLMSCSGEHNHGVYFQAPRFMDLWEVMFAVGELPDADIVAAMQEATEPDEKGDDK